MSVPRSVLTAVSVVFTDAFSSALRVQVHPDTMLDIRDSPQGLALLVCRVLDIRPTGARCHVPEFPARHYLGKPLGETEQIRSREVELYRLAGLEQRTTGGGARGR